MKQPQRKNRKGRKFRPLHVLLCCVVVSCALLGIMLTQKNKLAEIAAEQAALQAEKESLLVEEQRLQRMLDYVGTDEYLSQFARDKLGYVLPGDYKFYREGD